MSQLSLQEEENSYGSWVEGKRKAEMCVRHIHCKKFSSVPRRDQEVHSDALSAHDRHCKGMGLKCKRDFKEKQAADPHTSMSKIILSGQ